MKPPSRLPDKKIQNNEQMNLDLDIEINKEFEENFPDQEGIISEIYQRLHKSQLIEPPELADLIDTNQRIQIYLPKQTDIDKILKVIQRKVLKGTHLPATVKEIQAGYLDSPYFKDLYLLYSKQIGKLKKLYMQSQSPGREIDNIGFIIIQIEPRKRKSSLSYTRKVCRSNNFLVPYKFICRSLRYSKNIPDYGR